MPTRLNGPIIKLDLLQPSHLQLVKDLITNRACVYVHFAQYVGQISEPGSFNIVIGLCRLPSGLITAQMGCHG